MSVITYSLSNNFNGYILPEVLKEQIDTKEGIDTNCLSVAIDGSLVNITFDGVLTTEERTLLDDVINHHHEAFANIEFENSNIYLITVPVKVKSSSYQEIATFRYNGFIKNILIISQGIDYSIRLYDLTNKKIIFEQSFNNKDYKEDIIPKEAIHNIPTNDALIAVQVNSNKVNCNIKLFQVNT